MTVHVSGRSIFALLLQWDDPVEKHLPEFTLVVRASEPNDRATLRDVLSHRTGFTRVAFLEITLQPSTAPGQAK